MGDGVEWLFISVASSGPGMNANDRSIHGESELDGTGDSAAKRGMCEYQGQQKTASSAAHEVV